MVIDTSAICAILFNEPEATRFADIIGAATSRLISAATHVEAALVLESRNPSSGRQMLERFLEAADAVVVSVTAQQAVVAIDAFRRYGKGRHPAGLNLGDCFSYALARSTGETLLFKGDDFARTDIGVAA